MTYTIEISENITYCFTKAQILEIVSAVNSERSSIGFNHTTTIAVKDIGAVQADRDDMYNIMVYGADEDTMDAEVFQIAATVVDDEIRYEDIDMPKIQEVEVNGERFALTEDAYHCSMLWIGDNRYTAKAVNRETGRTSRVYWDITHPDADEEDGMCDWDEPSEAEAL